MIYTEIGQKIPLGNAFSWVRVHRDPPPTTTGSAQYLDHLSVNPVYVLQKQNLFSLCRDMLGFCSYIICYRSLRSAFNVTVFYIILLLFSLKKSSLLSTRNVGHFVLFMLLTCSQCTVVSITFFSALFIYNWSSSFVLAVFTRPCYSVNSVTCAPFACFCFGSLLQSVVFWLFIIRMSWSCNCFGLSCSPHQAGLPCLFHYLSPIGDFFFYIDGK